MSELKPCPFCGSTKLTIGAWWISCDKCGAAGPAVEKQKVKAAWNARGTTPTTQPASEPDHGQPSGGAVQGASERPAQDTHRTS